MVELEKNLEDPTDETRVRFLEGRDNSPAEMKDKIQEVSAALWTVSFLELTTRSW